MLDEREGGPNVRVQKTAGNRTVMGTFVMRDSDSLQADGQTMVVMKRSKVRQDPHFDSQRFIHSDLVFVFWLIGWVLGIDITLESILVVNCER